MRRRQELHRSGGPGEGTTLHERGRHGAGRPVPARTGPPPHARGRLRVGTAVGGRHGTNPARAGKTRTRSRRTSGFADHPRTRGEDGIVAISVVVDRGPPPHARGRRTRSAPRPLRAWTTPARAGEDSSDHSPSSSNPGPPPHARGRPPVHPGRLARVRTTPARAGKTPAPWATGAGRRDHPRTRGEDIVGMFVAAGTVGPSPHARGRLGVESDLGAADRTTPARAGKTRPRRRARPVCSDHPRTRGEDSVIRKSVRVSGGPPPHARGRPTGTEQDSSRSGTTPARAGKTRSTPTTACSPTDHPRTRGEDRMLDSTRSPP